MNPFKSAKEAYDERKAARKQAKADKELAKAQAAVRKPQSIQEQYAKLCGLAGDKQYRIEALKAELIQINEAIYKLNQEFEKSKAVHGDVAPVAPAQTPAPQENKVEAAEGANEAAH